MSISEARERQLIERARAGEPDTWELLYRRAYPRLFAYTRRRLSSEEQAEEAVSETMVRAMGKIAGYAPGPSGIEGWLFGIARNVVLETYRAGSRQTPTDPEFFNDQNHLSEPGPEVAVLAAEECSIMARAFARLPQHEQELLEMRVVVGLDAQQVAALTDKRAGAVRTAQSRALQRLRTEFKGLMA